MSCQPEALLTGSEKGAPAYYSVQTLELRQQEPGLRLGLNVSTDPPMRRTIQLLEKADPAVLQLVGQAFDEAWLAMADNYSERQAEFARWRLATHILRIANEPGWDAATLRDEAIAAVRRDEQPLDFLSSVKS